MEEISLEQHINEAKAILDQMAEDRGILVVDENLAGLKPFLEEKGFTVLLPPKGMSDEDILDSHFLSRRIFVTDNSKDFKYRAVENQYSIIATEKVTKDQKTLAKIISRAMIDFSLRSKKRDKWMLQLEPNGRHKLVELEP